MPSTDLLIDHDRAQVPTLHVVSEVRVPEIVTVVSAPKPALAVPARESADAGRSARRVPDPITTPSLPTHAGLRTAAWISVATTAALAAGAGAALIVRDSNIAAYNDDGRCFFGGLTRDQRCGGYRNAAGTGQVVAFAATGAVAIAAGVSVLLFVLSSPTRTQSSRTAFDCFV
ncbi:MAG: hypothetical protein ACREJ3_00845, partial [Polyangiaceae bacterium]